MNERLATTKRELQHSHDLKMALRRDPYDISDYSYSENEHRDKKSLIIKFNPKVQKKKEEMENIYKKDDKERDCLKRDFEKFEGDLHEQVISYQQAAKQTRIIFSESLSVSKKELKFGVKEIEKVVEDESLKPTHSDQIASFSQKKPVFEFKLEK